MKKGEFFTRRENSFCHLSLEREAVGQRRNRKMYEKKGERKDDHIKKEALGDYNQMQEQKKPRQTKWPLRKNMQP